jgi:diadenosine tetraphosphatase ApaH/serine/threonine PP2A family protein phosphatase
MIAVVTDIHGNLPALQAVLDRIDELGCERIISLGDITGYYAQPAECIALLQDRDAIQLLGNHDKYLVDGSGCPRSRLVSELLKHQEKAVPAEQLAFLSTLESRYDEGNASFVHGGWRDPLDEYVYQIEPDRFPNDFEFFFSGHTHVQCKVPLGDDRVYCNPGSVGQPRDGDKRAAFAVFTGDDVELHRVDYDIDAAAQAMRDAGFDEERLWMNLYEGAQIGGRIDKITIMESTA